MRPVLGTEEIIAIKKVLDSKFLTEGKITKTFENNVAKYTHSKYAIATTSATTALHAAFESVNVKKKKVLVSDFTFPATALAVIQAGGIPVLVDVERDTMNVSREIIEKSGKKFNFICPVSLFGNSLHEDFYKLKNKGSIIIEDAATNLGVKIRNKYVGNLADITCFSFHPRKIITTGEGGMITTNNKKFNDIIRSFKAFGKIGNKFMNLGTNYKLSDIQSAVGISQMGKIERIIKKRNEIADIYDELISKMEYVEPQRKTPNSRHTSQSYVCVISKPNLRDKIIQKLAENNIESQIGTYALHCLPIFRKITKIGSLINSEYLYKNSISLPLHGELDNSDQERICMIIKKCII
jgi:dTDP-4-amino-4,6-dideoxygalactose transaminase